MTQLVNKASSWRTLRHKVVVGASSIALVAGMGVALAPAANAADANPKVTLTVPANISNTGADSAFSIKVENNTGAAVTNLAGFLTVTLPTGLQCSGVLATGTVQIGTPAQAFLDIQAGTQDSTNKNVCVYEVKVNNGTAGTLGNTESATGNYNFVIETRTGTNPIPTTGTVTAKFDLNAMSNANGTGVATKNLASVTKTGELTTATGVKFAEGAVPAPKVGFSYSYKLVANAGFPAAVQASYKIVGAHEKANGTFDYTTITPSGAVVPLSAPDDATNPHDSGFSFNTTTGRIVSNGGVTSNPSQYWTWTVIANNRAAGPVFTTASVTTMNGVVPRAASLTDGDVASAQFDLSTAPAVVSFSDYAKTATFGTEVYALAGAGIIQGYDDGTFRPTAPVSRQAFAAYAVRTLDALGYDWNGATSGLGTAPSGKCFLDSGFSDVSKYSQFCGEINWLVENGITEGYNHGAQFRPTAPISRQAIAAFLFRLDSIYGTDGTNGVTPPAADPQCTAASKFSDVSTDNQFCGVIEWLANTEADADGNAISTGYADGTFKPTASTSRQAASTFFYRFGNMKAGEAGEWDAWS